MLFSIMLIIANDSIDLSSGNSPAKKILVEKVTIGDHIIRIFTCEMLMILI